MIKGVQMAHILTQPDDAYIPADLIGVTHMTPEQFEQAYRKHNEIRLELSSAGELIVMPPADAETRMHNASLTNQLMAWTRKDATGVCFGNSAGFTLPNSAIRSPDASWMSRERWDSLSQQQKQHFAPICPDFVVELRSRPVWIPFLFSKMAEYLANGASLGWLIDPSLRRVYVYQPDQAVDVLETPATVSAEPLLPGFTLNLAELW